MITPDFATDTKLVGVTADNDSGVPIQILLPMLEYNDPLIFIREYNNRYDPNAIKVFGKSGQHIGYLKKELVAELSPFLDQHSEFELEGMVNEITGGSGKTYGCNIRIWLHSCNSPDYDEFEFFTEQYKKPYDTQNVNPPAQQDIYHQTKNIILIGVIILMVIFALAKCDDALNSWFKEDDNNSKNVRSTSSVTEAITPPVKIEELIFDFTVLPPNSIGTIWLNATFVNTSDKPITYFSAKILLKDTNKTTYLSCTDTVMPGETSPIFKTFGPESQNKNDIEFLTCTIKTYDDSGEEIYVEYDYKLKKYRTF